MGQLDNIEAIEKRLWIAADTLRANSSLASNEYFLPVMGLLFLRHAYSRYLNVKKEIEKSLPTRNGKPRPLTKEDFSQKSAIYLQPKAEFDYLVQLKDSDDRAKAIIEAMESIEADYKTLEGILPKNDYNQLDNEVLGNLLRILDPDELRNVDGDIFGRIYEYFLTQFAGQKAHDGGEFFTPVSLVSFIANTLEPEKGIILDPACGSGGMFVQSAHFVEKMHKNPMSNLVFYGVEKNSTTVDLAKMNLAVHGLQGNISKENSYYKDPHDMYHKADYVMANPPFNVDEIDAEKIKNDPRLPFGLPGVNKKGKVSNGNYVWISYFYSYLNDKGRAGFVMSSQSSSAGNTEALVRQKLVETGDVDIMVSIRTNFFYTRAVPCELWFLNRNKPPEMKDKVLMLDARNVYRQVTRKIYDFSPEQLQNLLSVIWLYRGQSDRFIELVQSYVDTTINRAISTVFDYMPALESYISTIDKSLINIKLVDESKDLWVEVTDSQKTLTESIGKFQTTLKALTLPQLTLQSDLPKELSKLNPLLEQVKLLIKHVESTYRLTTKFVEHYENDLDATNNPDWPKKELIKQRKVADEERQILVDQIKQIKYFYHHADWLISRFPEAKLRDVEGLVKLVDREKIKDNDWSLTPGRYVGVAPEIVDEDFDFEEVMTTLHAELEDLNAQSILLAEQIKKNFEELVI